MSSIDLQQQNLEQGLAALKAAQATAMTDNVLIKSFTQPGSATTGLQAYDLAAPSKKFYPVLTPLRNSIPRPADGYAIQANWKVITNINVGNQRAGVGEGKRGGKIQHESADYFASYRGWGLENDVTFEANYASKNFEDVKALAVQQTLEATMIQEERLILGGNTTLAMGTTPTPTLAGASSGGTLTNTTWSVICVALGLQAWLDVAGANNGAIGQEFTASAQVPARITRSNADGTSDTFGGGSAQKSASATVATTGTTSQITATVTPVNGAVGYAWYLGPVGSERLVAISSINSTVLKAAPDGAAQLASDLQAQDNSTSGLDFDGLLVQAFKPSSKAYIKVMPTGTAGVGSTLTSDGAGGIVEINEAFANFYNKYRLSPDVIYVNAQELESITMLIIKNGGAPLLHLNVDAMNPASLQAGVVVGSYQNKLTGARVPLQLHPNLAPGTIFFFTKKLPYQLANITSICQMRMRQDYYQIEWPLKSRKYEYGVYADGVLQHFAPFSMGIITNIAKPV